MKYADFALKIEPKQGDAYPVGVVSPAGEGRSELLLPFSLDEVGTILTNLGYRVRGAGAEPARDSEELPAAPGASVEEMGDRLFAALFAGPVRSLFDWSLGNIHGTGTGLRIKIHIDPTDPSLAQLASLPWEFLYRRETRDWLNLSRYTPIVRYLDVQRPHAPLSLRPPLRILVVISQPVGCPQLDLDEERALIDDSWARLQGVEVEFLEVATPEALSDRLTREPYHVLHYMGHGDFDERTGRGVLLLEDKNEQPRPTDGPTLGILLRDVPSLRMVVLNACETARVTKVMGLDPFAGVASALVMAGIPAVVAMQFPISDDAAISFADRFYELLARGEAVDTAVAGGRRAIRTSLPDSLEWGTPVLFMRAADGIIFHITGEPEVPAPAPEVEREPASAADEQARREVEEQERQARLAALFSEATRLGESDPNRTLEILAEIRQQQADYPGLAELEARARAAAARRWPPPGWVWAAAGGVLALLVVALLLIVLRPWSQPAIETPTPPPGAASTATEQLPAAEPMLTYVPISLAQVANSLIESGFPTFPSGRFVVKDVPFDIAAEGCFASQAVGAPHHAPSVTLAADVPNPREVHLLITSGDGYIEYKDKEIGRIRLVFANGQYWDEPLRLGWNIREWKQAGPGTVNTADHPALTLAFSSGIRVIDMLSVEIPSEFMSLRLTAIIIDDTSEANCGSLSPALNVCGVTVMRGQ